MVTRVRIPQYDQRTSVQMVGAPQARAVPQVSAMDVAGPMVARAGRDIEQAAESIAEQNAQVWTARALAGAREEWTRQMLDRQQSAEPGAPDFTPTLLRDYDTWTRQILSTAPSPRSRAYLDERLSSLRGSMAGDAMQFEARARVDNRVRQAGETVNLNRNTVMRSPGQFPAVLGETVAMIDGMQGLPPIERARLRREAESGLAQSAIQGMIQNAPGNALREIQSGRWDRYLDADRRGALLNHAQSRIDHLTTQGRIAQERAERMADRALREQERQVGNDGFTRHAEGMLTYEWLQENRNRMNATDYRALLRATRGGTDFDQPEAVVTLTEQIDRMPPDQFQQQAARYVNDGMLRPETYRSMVERNRAARRDDEPASAYRAGRDFIREGLDPGALGSGPQELALRQGRARALAEWDEWAQRNPSATRDDAMRQAEAIQRRYQALNLSGLRIALPLPYGYSGDRQAIDASAVSSARERIAADMESGALSRTQGAREWEYLDSWEAALARTGTAPRPAGSGGAAPARAPAAPSPASRPSDPAARAPSNVAPIPARDAALAEREAVIEWLRVNDPAVWRTLPGLPQDQLLRTLEQARTRMQAPAR